MDMSIPPFNQLHLDTELVADLRSDHAGETGAVAIYRGILFVARDAEVRRFALRHIRAELRHLRFFDAWLPAAHRSRLLPLWRAAGFSLGAFAALFGARSVYRTVAAVETFVEQHYMEQVEHMRSEPELAALAAQLERFCAEEVHHRIDAAQRVPGQARPLGRLWSRIVGAGSAAGVRVARAI